MERSKLCFYDLVYARAHNVSLRTFIFNIFLFFSSSFLSFTLRQNVYIMSENVDI